MPRSIQEIIDHADSLVSQFEAFDEAGAVERPVSEVLLRRAPTTRPVCRTSTTAITTPPPPDSSVLTRSSL